jgi:uncharacterized membrane protein YhaH (DUF805 family)
MFGLDLSTVLFAIVVPLALFVVALIDMVKRQFHDGVTKIIWAFVVLFVPLLGPILYLVVGRKQGTITV